MRGIVLILALGISIGNTYAQAGEGRKCGTSELRKHLAAIDNNLDQVRRQELHQLAEEARISTLGNSASKTTASGTIPIVFHIVLNQSQVTALGGTAGIQQRIDSQIAVINRDFNARNADTSKIPAAFKSLLGNPGIQFGLARRKPDGTHTPGYEILTTTASGIEESGNVGSGMSYAEAKFTNGVANAWDPSVYLNVWVVNPLDNGSASSILGVTMPPSFLRYNIPGMTNNELGIVLNSGAFGVRAGSLSGFISGITGGRTLTHELGHYFEVWHVWGDDDGKCPGSGGDDDGISDTPPQEDATYGCPSYPQTDNCTSSGSGIMFMNYMDYVNDACMYMFTAEQAKVMSNLVQAGKESYSLTQHPDVLLVPTAVTEVAENPDVSVFPNPATDNVYITSNASLNSIVILNVAGQIIKKIEIDNIIANCNIDISTFPNGVYILQINTTSGTSIKRLTVQ